MHKSFYLNKQDGKLMGVCAGLSDYTGIDVLWIRLAVALLLFAGFGSLFVVYIVVGLFANKRPRERDRPLGPGGIGDNDWRDRNSLYGDFEGYYSSSNPQLSRQIDGLR